MEYTATNHAIERFMEWQRTSHEEITREKAEKKLIEIAKKGKFVGERPNNSIEVEYKKLFAVTIEENNRTVVITFNGDAAWRAWFRKQKYKPRIRNNPRRKKKISAGH